MLDIKEQTPPREKLYSLFDHYKNARYEDAEKLAIVITKQFPLHQFSWKILGVVLQLTGRISDALVINQKSVELNTQDAEAHNNLGNTLQQLGRLEEAEESCRQAILLRSGYIEPHYNLGNILKELGRLEDAVASYRKVIELKPDYAEAHYNLGNAFKELGRLEDAVSSYRKVIELKPGFAEFHNTLGFMQQELGRSEEAEASYRQAITLKSDDAEIYNNLGLVLQELNRLEEAETIYRQAIELKPDFLEVHNNLGLMLQELNRLEEAETIYRRAMVIKPNFAENYRNLGNTLQKMGRLEDAVSSNRKAIELKPDFAEFHSNLGLVLQEIGRLEEAEASYRQAIILKPDYAEAMINLSMVLGYMNNLDAEICVLENLLIVDRDSFGLRAAVILAIHRFLKDDFTISKKYLLESSEIQNKLTVEFLNEKIYQNYLLKILSWHENKSSKSLNTTIDKNIYVIGESHALVSHGLRVQTSDNNFLCKSLLIMGCKQWYLGNSIKNKYKIKFENIFRSLPKSSKILLAIGEIDCRLDSGIIKHKNKYPEKNITELILRTIESYLKYIYKMNDYYNHKIIIQGVPCPNISLKNISKEKVTELIDLIKEFNDLLKSKSIEIGFDFLDVYKLTDRGDGFSNLIWHIDTVHLSPEGMTEAWRMYYSG